MNTRTDLYLQDSGDLTIEQVIGPGGEPLLDPSQQPYYDFSIAYDRRVLIQGAMCRIKTQLTDWYTYPALGADLERFIGEPNTPSTADRIIDNIRHALTYDNFIRMGDLEIYAVPVNNNEVIFYVRVEHRHDAPTVMAIPFNYYEGLGV